MPRKVLLAARKSAPSLGTLVHQDGDSDSQSSSTSSSSPEVSERTQNGSMQSPSAARKRKHNVALPSSARIPKAARKSVVRRTPSPSLSDSEGERQLLRQYFKTPVDEQRSSTGDHHSSNGTVSATLPDASATEIIQELSGQIHDLHDFIYRQGIALRAPASIRKYLDARPNAPHLLASAIHRDMAATCSKISNCKRRNEAMLPYLSEIHNLSRLSQSQSLDLAIELMTEFAARCYGDEEEWKWEEEADERATDRPADMLFCSLIRRRLHAVPAWDANSILNRLLGTKDYLSKFGLEKGYFDRTIRAIQTWQRA